MKLFIQRFAATLMLGLLSMACSEEEATVKKDPLIGNWKLAPLQGSLAVGPAPGDYSWWSITAGDLITRACLYDDVYQFNEDGTFQNVLGSATWLESFQGVANEGCGAPVAPHNGSVQGTWKAENQKLTITGSGCYMGLPKVHNTAEDGKPANNSIIYDYQLSSDGTSLTLTIKGWLPAVPNATWYFRFTKQS